MLKYLADTGLVSLIHHMTDITTNNNPENRAADDGGCSAISTPDG
jgi:hypothetical protein